MKFTIKRQLTFVFIFLITAIIFICWCINAFFLETIYSSGKQKNLMQAYEILMHYSEEGEVDSEQFSNEIQRVCNINNISYIITDANSNTIKTSINDPEAFNHQLRDVIFSHYEGNQKVIKETDSYIISEIFDNDNQMRYMAMWGTLSGENFFMLRTSLDGIRTSVKLASVFMLNVSGCVLLVAFIVIHFVAKKISDPIMELASISEQMAKLDFETKYQGKSKNEIAVLGRNFNEMSEKLEEAIGNLKTANLELQNDMQNREKIDQMRKEFMTNVSHELKTPIALIQGYAEGLQEGIIDDTESRDYYCEVIMDETKKMNKLVMQLMTLSQLETGGDINEMERFDIVGVILNCIQSDELLAKQKGIQVFFEKPEPIYVWADEFKIEQVFRNYFSNAINHCDGKKEIYISVSVYEDVARISVYNTGMPIPDDSIAYLWDKFYKVDKARTREYGGTGIGLSIVKAIMESHNQKYGVENHEDGVEFWFEVATK